MDPICSNLILNVGDDGSTSPGVYNPRLSGGKADLKYEMKVPERILVVGKGKYFININCILIQKLFHSIFRARSACWYEGSST